MLDAVDRDAESVPKRTRRSKGSGVQTSVPPSHHILHQGDGRDLGWIGDETVHLVVTSPPYWTLKKYNDHPGQLGDMGDYEVFHDELDKVWRHCYCMLVPGGRVVCVVGDVCLRGVATRVAIKSFRCTLTSPCGARRIGFDYLTPIYWQKIANASYEVENGSSFLGKPFEPNAILKNDTEYILMLRKSGGYRKPTEAQRVKSKMTKDEYNEWFRSLWTGLTGASTKAHPAPFPEELAYRLVRMFSFVEDTVVDPFMGTGSTTMAAIRAGRNSIGNELDPKYFKMAVDRISAEVAQGSLFGPGPTLEISGMKS